MDDPTRESILMNKIVRALIPLDSQEIQTFDLALAYAEKIAEAAGVADVILITHTKGQLDHTGLSRLLGAGATKALTNGKTAGLAWGGRLHGETIKTLRYSARNAVIIAYYADEKLLDHVDGLTNVSGVVAVPWIPGEADGWAARWNAIIHGQERAAAKPLIDDVVVVRALESLTTLINPTTGLGHPRDKAWASDTLRILRAKGHQDPSGTIKSWAIRHNWSVSAAADLETLSRKIWALKNKPSLASIHDPNGRYERWKSGGA